MIDDSPKAHLAATSEGGTTDSTKHGGRRLRILCLSSDLYPPFRVDVAVLFGQELQSRGHRFDWILQSMQARNCSGQEDWHGAKVWVGQRKDGRAITARLYNFAAGIFLDLKAFAWTSLERYDAIQVKDKFLAGIYALVISRTRKIKFFYWLSYPFPEAWTYHAKTGQSRFPLFDILRGKLSAWLLYKVLLPRADHIFVQSDQMLKNISSKGIHPASMTAIHMGACLKRMPSLPVDESEPYTISYLGDLGKTRRIDFLLRSFALVLERLPQAKLLLIGGAEAPADESELQDLANTLGIAASVEFTGHLPIEAAWTIARRSQIGVSPLANTPVFAAASPTKVVEYLALGKPVVVNDHPDQRKIVEESGAGICTGYDEAEFAQGMLDLLGQQAALHEMGRKGRSYIEKHRSYEVLADLVERKYLEICRSP